MVSKCSIVINLRRSSRKLRFYHHALPLSYHCLSADVRNLFLKAPLSRLFYSLLFTLDVMTCSPAASAQDPNVQEVDISFFFRSRSARAWSVNLEQGPLHHYSHFRGICTDRNDPGPVVNVKHMQNPDNMHRAGETWQIHCKPSWDQRNPKQKNSCLLKCSFQARQLQNHEELMERIDSVSSRSRGWQYGNEWPTPGFYFRLCHRHPGSFSRNFQAAGFKLLGKVSIVAFFARGNRELVSLFFPPSFRNSHHRLLFLFRIWSGAFGTIWNLVKRTLTLMLWHQALPSVLKIRLDQWLLSTMLRLKISWVLSAWDVDTCLTENVPFENRHPLQR